MTILQTVALLVTAIVPAVTLKPSIDATADETLEELLDVEIHRRGESGPSLQTGDTSLDYQMGASHTSVTLSPEQRAIAHTSKFEKDFVVELDMSTAVEGKQTIGVVLELDTDFQPVSVSKIKKTGILEAWNKMHPDRAVLVGDEIVKVNDITWHANSETFAQRIKHQFLASRAQLPGARNVLSLTIQRPRKEKAIRFQSQRDDVHRQLYSKEFVAEIPLRGECFSSISVCQSMGWKLNVSVDWMPLSIEEILKTGIIPRYNQEHPDTKILVGDEILRVNHVQWHHNAKVFEERLRAQFAAGQKSELLGTSGSENVLRLNIRRPRSVLEVLEEQVYTKQYSVHLTLKDAHPLGWRLNKSSGVDPLAVEEIEKGSPLYDYNEANPQNMVRVGDTVLSVNDILLDADTHEVARHIDEEVDKARSDVQSNNALTLVMQRRLVQPITKEWTVTIPTDYRGLGWQLNYSDDEFPLTVSKVRSSGLVFEHNQEHSDSKILAGDVIVKVNGLLWRQDSSTFEKRLNEEYSESKKSGNISFFLRRPFGVKDASQDENRPFYKELSIHLPIMGGETLGWQLSSDNDTAPVIVTNVGNVGAVYNWNEANPFTSIQVGDRIASVNNVLWRGKAKQFLEQVSRQLDSARKGKGKQFVTVFVQRPWPVRETSSKEVDGGGGDAAGGGDDADSGGVVD